MALERPLHRTHLHYTYDFLFLWYNGLQLTLPRSILREHQLILAHIRVHR